MTVKHLYLKHTGLPIADLLVAYEIDAANRLVRLDLKDHFDSGLLITVVRRVLEEEECLRIIDNQSHSTWGPARIEYRFDVELTLAGQLFDVQIVQMSPHLRAKDAPPEFTISMHKKKCSDDQVH